jgi:hypothetical protein
LSRVQRVVQLFSRILPVACSFQPLTATALSDTSTIAA